MALCGHKTMPKKDTANYYYCCATAVQSEVSIQRRHQKKKIQSRCHIELFVLDTTYDRHNIPGTHLFIYMMRERKRKNKENKSKEKGKNEKAIYTDTIKY